MNFCTLTISRALAIVAIFSHVAEAQFTCVGTCYKGHFSEIHNKKTDHALVGHSFLNVSTPVPQQCLSACVSNCRCLAFQLKQTRCELLDANKDLAPQHFNNQSQGYVYYDVPQTLDSTSESSGSCMNGCCKSNPCLNGGTCNEHCDNVTVKFSCSCPHSSSGNLCEKKARSCLDYYLQNGSLSNGIYELLDGSDQVLEVFCDFTSEASFVWTLIESFKFIENPDVNFPYYENVPISERSPNFEKYRLSLNSMTYIRADTTLFRATCEFDKEPFTYADYLRGNLSSVDIMSSNLIWSCQTFERIEVRGIACQDCEAKFLSGEISSGFRHAHIQTSSSNACANGPNWANSVGGEDSFGNYGTYQANHRCVQNNVATSQWWLGVKVSSEE